MINLMYYFCIFQLIYVRIEQVFDSGKGEDVEESSIFFLFELFIFWNFLVMDIYMEMFLVGILLVVYEVLFCMFFVDYEVLVVVDFLVLF